MHLYFLPVLYSLFIWWFSTGIIVYLDGLPRYTFSPSFSFLSLLLFLSMIGLVSSRNDASVSGAYLAFTCGLMIWGWQIASFYMGIITGPRRIPCPAGSSTWQRFRYALAACLYHELASLAGALLILAITWGSVNPIGLYTYLVLWGLHQSAKLNVFFGVRNLNEEFLPEHMKFLASYFSYRPMNRFFPFSVTAATALMVFLCQQAATAVRAVDAVGFSFLACMATLGLLEIWLLVVPLPLNLWDWSLSSHRKRTAKSVKWPGTERL
jgi:putative photosynthetic complex assembly protein 2